MTLPDCPFCRIIHGEEPGDFVRWTFGTENPGLPGSTNGIVLRPLRPVTPGHLLVIPTRHAASAAAEPETTANTFGAASRVADELGKPSNLITSIGTTATQSVFHLHVHVVPRRRGDGLKLPWSR